MDKRNIGARLRNHCCSGKAISVTYSESVSVVLVIQHATRGRLIVICDLSGSIPYFSKSFLKQHDFRKNVIEGKT
jgi:hypothetical protein